MTNLNQTHETTTVELTAALQSVVDKILEHARMRGNIYEINRFGRKETSSLTQFEWDLLQSLKPIIGKSINSLKQQEV